MDTDLMTLWLNAEYLSKDEARDLITELQAARDDERTDVDTVRKAFDALVEAGVDDWSRLVGKLGAAIEAWESS
jgi:hypothetical protein